MPERSSITAFKEVLDDIVDAQQLIDSSNSLAKSFESINLKSASDHNAIIEKTKNIIDQLKEKVVTLHNNFHKHYSIWKNTKKTSHVSESNSDISENQETNLQELTVDDSFDMMSHNTNNDILVANVSVNKKNIKDNSEIVINNITKNIEHSVTDLIVGIDENVTSKGGTNNKADMIDNNKRKCDQSFSNVFSVDSILQLNLSEHNTTDIADHVTVDQLSNDKINELNKSDERTCNNAVMKNNVNDLPANDNSNDLYSSSKTSKNKEANRLDSDVTVKDESAFKIKCVDIKKLLEPDIASPNVINKNKVSEIPNTPTTSPNINTSVVIISDSDNDTSTKTHTKAKIKGNKNKKKENNLKISLSKKRVIVVDDSDSDYNIGDTKNERRSSLRNEFLKHRKTLNRSRSKRLENISSSNILNEKRPRRNLIQDLTNVSSLSDNGSSSSSSSDDSHYDSRNRKKKVISKNKKVSCENRDIYSMNVKDKKFSCKAYVPLPRLPSEELKENYKKKLENIDIRRLTNMESLKRLRKYSTNSVSSNSSAATSEKKRHCSQENGKDLANKEKSDKDADISTDRENHKRKVREASESSNISASSVEKKRRVEEDGDSKSDKNDDFDMLKEPTPNDPRKNEDEIAKALLDGIGSDDCNSNHNSDSASKISDKEKDVNKNKNKDQSNKQEKKDRKEQTVNTDDTDAEANKEKNKWRKDKLLTENITDSDSGEDFTRFLKKKEVVEGKKSDTAEKTPNKSKKRLKRRKAVLGSDSDSSASAKSESASSKSKSESSESERNSDSDNIAKKPTRRRIKKIQDSSAEDDDNGEDKSTRKNIRKVWKKKSLADTTIAAEKEEEERKARIAEKQKKYNLIFESDLLQKATVDKVVLDFNEETKEELLKIDQTLVKHLKPHQAMGIQFMWDACFESIDRARKTKGSGCILAHCMGLGKTLQVISLIHTLVNNDEKTGIKKVLVVCPLSTVLNWVAEFKKWLTNDDDVEIYELVSFKQNNERMYQVKEWDRVGGALIVGYDMYRNLTNPTNKRLNKKIRNTFHTCLVDPGPDLVVCDEGHLLKNEKTSLSIAMNRMQTLRRIVLTGTPLQNNLKEYFCMVQFVKPNLLGTYREYLNRFVNPITNGQYTDSTQHDIHIMRKRSHVLHKLLDGVVQRKDYSVLAPFLPPKHEYVLFVSLTEVQIKLYEHYMREKSRRKSCDGGRSFIFTDFNEFQRICTHPRVLLDKSTQLKQARDRKDFLDDESEGSLKDFIDDDETEKSSASSSSKSSGDSDSGSNSDGSHKKNKKSSTQNQRLTRSNASTFDFDKEDSAVEEADPSEWWQQYCQDDDLDNIAHSGKLSLLFEILRQCELIGDKVLVFSQSLYSLNVIEYFLSQIDDATQNSETNSFCGYSGSWSQGLDYFRLDGSSSCENRAAWCKTFNDSDNTRARLFLISTKAGGLGINLVAANRVIIFDVSWNPSHDTQSIYRVYRFGQTKPSFIYRFVTLGTMEMKVYERQVIKQAISKRVIDEQQIDRHYNQNDLAELYKFEPIPEEDRPTPLVPKDLLLGELLQMDKKIYKYHEHQSLLENKVDEVLDEEERKAAWEEFENEKKARSYTGTINNVPVQSILIGLQSIIRKGNPTMANEAVYDQATKMFKMLEAEIETGKTTLFNKAVQEVQQIQAAHARMLQYQQEEFFRQYAQQVYNSQINPYMMNRTAMHNYPTQRIPSSATFAQAAMENQNPVEYIDLND